VAALSAPLVAAVAAVAVGAVFTGGLHLDGLADAADALLGGGCRERRLEIMRDPRIGSFGAVALFLVLAGDVAALSAMPPARALAALVVAGALSRFALLAVVVLVPYVRIEGLGVMAQGRHRVTDLVVGCLLALLACLLDVRRAGVAAVLVALGTLSVVAMARRRIGGATGDVYGACTEVAQLAALLAFAAP
jgi:adenosylcobinamide-GDP ribazoletransferase